MSIGERVKQARHLRAFSLRDLGKRAGLSAQAISKYERDLDVPSSGALLRMARALELSAEFFVRPPRLSRLTADAGSPLSVKQERAVLAKVRDWLERYLEIELIRSPAAAEFRMPGGFPRTVGTEAEIEEAAIELREGWQLGLAPIENLTELLEDRGLKIGLFKANLGSDVRAFTALSESPVPVFAIRTGLPGDRQRFLLASELARLMLRAKDSLDEETAHRFAAAFLVPALAARFELGARRKSLSPHELHLLKHKYGLSMREWVRRAGDLGILAPSRFRALWRQFRANGWLEREPGDPLPAEQPSRFHRLVMQALDEDVIREARAGELLGQPVRHFLDEFAEEHEDFPVALRC